MYFIVTTWEGCRDSQMKKTQQGKSPLPGCSPETSFIPGVKGELTTHSNPPPKKSAKMEPAKILLTLWDNVESLDYQQPWTMSSQCLLFPARDLTQWMAACRNIQWLMRSAQTIAGEVIMHSSSQVGIQQNVSSSKLPTVGAFILWKSANAPNQTFVFCLIC